MIAHGPFHIDQFGTGNILGYSAMQFIETSSIVVHADDKGDRCFIDIFSCKDFDTKSAAEFSKNFFGAKHMDQTTLVR